MQLATISHPATALEGFRGISPEFLRPGAAAIVPWKEYARLRGIDPTVKKKDVSDETWKLLKQENDRYKQLCREAQGQRRQLAAAVVADSKSVVSNIRFATRKNKVTGEKEFVPGKLTISVAPAKEESAPSSAKAQLDAANAKIAEMKAKLEAAGITVE